MWPCLCNFRVKSCDPGSTNHPQQSPSRLPNNSVATGCKLFFWMNKRSSSDNWPKPWFRSRPKMSQWESTALATTAATNLWFDLAFDLPPYYLSGQTQRQDSAKATLQELSNRTYRTSPSGPTALTVSFHSLPGPTVRSESKSLRALQQPILILPHQQRCIPSSSNVANPWGHIPAWLCMTKCLRGKMKYRCLGAQSLHSMTILKCDYAISGHEPDASLLALHNQNEKLWGLLRNGNPHPQWTATRRSPTRSAFPLKHAVRIQATFHSGFSTLACWSSLSTSYPSATADYEKSCRTSHPRSCSLLQPFAQPVANTWRQWLLSLMALSVPRHETASRHATSDVAQANAANQALFLETWDLKRPRCTNIVVTHPSTTAYLLSCSAAGRPNLSQNRWSSGTPLQIEPPQLVSRSGRADPWLTP